MIARASVELLSLLLIWLARLQHSSLIINGLSRTKSNFSSFRMACSAARFRKKPCLGDKCTSLESLDLRCYVEKKHPDLMPTKDDQGTKSSATWSLAERSESLGPNHWRPGSAGCWCLLHATAPTAPFSGISIWLLAMLILRSFMFSKPRGRIPYNTRNNSTSIIQIWGMP